MKGESYLNCVLKTTFFQASCLNNNLLKKVVSTCKLTYKLHYSTSICYISLSFCKMFLIPKIPFYDKIETSETSVFLEVYFYGIELGPYVKEELYTR